MSRTRTPEIVALWQSRETTASILVAFCIKVFGMECLEWEPETLEEEIREAIGAEPAGHCVERLLAGIVMLTTDQCQTDAIAFSRAANAASGEDPDADDFDLAEPEEMAWLLTEIALLSPPASDSGGPLTDEDATLAFVSSFSDEVRNMIRITMDYDGLYGSRGILGACAAPETVNRSEALPEMQDAKWREVDKFVEDRVEDLRRQTATLSSRLG